MSARLAQQLPKLVDQSVRNAHTMAFGKGVNYFPSLSKHGRPASISQGSQAQRDVRSSMSDPDMFMNYTPTSATSDSGRQAGTARHSFPGGVHVPEGGRLISTPDYPEPLRNSMTDADGQPLRRDMWPRRNVSNPSVIPHRTSALPEPLQNSMADAEYLDTRARQ
ncbi:hypothetical protein ABBQ32_005250 [Trebouxia sp. C0010 RCD-2024]